MILLRKVVFLSLFLVAVGSVSAAPIQLVGYDFESGSGTYRTADLTASGVAAGDIVDGSGLVLTYSSTADNSGSPFGSTSASNGTFINPGYGSGASEANAVANNNYLSFAVTSAPDSIDFDTLSFKFRRKGALAPQNFFGPSGIFMGRFAGTGPVRRSGSRSRS